jgi:hypothetical protein
MKQKLRKVLTDLDPTGFRELELAISVASNAIDLVSKYKISDEELADALNITKIEVRAFKTGAFPYTLRDIARLDAFRAKKELENK